MRLFFSFLVASLCVAANAQDAPFLGQWELKPAGGGAGWLEIKNDAGKFSGSLLWIGGSPEPLSTIFFDGDTLYALRVRTDMVKDAAGRITGSEMHPLLLTATKVGETLQGTFSEPSFDHKSVIKQDFTGVREPAMPPAPDLKKVKFGKAIRLFNGKDLKNWVVFGGAHWKETKDKHPEGGKSEGWVAKDDSVASGWKVKDGLMVNEQVQPEGQHLSFGNIATRQEFEDFNLRVEVRLPKNGNSGIYLRGLYEVQVADTFGKPLDPHNMGAVYARITPTASAEKPAGEWQTLDITLVDRHVTVKLNDTLIIDNQPVPGCTGGALTSDVTKPGPIYLQGDHTSIEYRSIVLRPVRK